MLSKFDRCGLKYSLKHSENFKLFLNFLSPPYATRYSTIAYITAISNGSFSFQEYHSEVFLTFRWLTEKRVASICEYTEYVISRTYNRSKPEVEFQSMFSSIIAFLSTPE